MSDFWVIDKESHGESIGAKTVFGPFETRKCAESFIVRDFEGWWKTSDLPLMDRDENACGTYFILEQKAEVRPVGKVHTKFSLVEVKE
jgi:acyl-CoA synthetase (AMP-forming)/AMP-acid ligase II